MKRVTATAPGKVMLAGEYAVLDGGLAIVAAIDRRAVATIGPWPAVAPPSEFLLAARAAVADLWGEDVARGFDAVTVDTDALREADRKLGLGSSAAATVAAIAAVFAASWGPDVRPGHVGLCALRAHGKAQAAKGARGSGADVHASLFGGLRRFRMFHQPEGAARSELLALPADCRLMFAWTGQPADTATLVAAVLAGRAANPTAADRALAAIAAAAESLAAATTGEAAIAAIADGGWAMAALAVATGVDLVPPSVATLAERLAPLGAAAKTTGAGGGDIVVVAAPATIDRTHLDAAIRAAGLQPLALAVDPTGVDIKLRGA